MGQMTQKWVRRPRYETACGLSKAAYRELTLSQQMGQMTYKVGQIQKMGQVGMEV
jgi:hypothetical protein